ncbi:MAG TPA: N-acyl homoserine lactonase family protein [Armatimonadota bacterium]|nr:N-acyl homoserine lactonase family protein [Armatimonadota bacterium]
MYTIHPLPVGESVEPEPRIFYLGDCSKTVRLWTYFWLVRGNGRNILVDTGFNMAKGETFNPEMKQPEDWQPLSRLSKLGVSPEEIDMVILTHLHWDHFSPTARQFESAVFWVNKTELEAVLAPPHPWFAQFVLADTIRQFKDQGRFREVEGDREIAEGISVLHTGGHTPGNQSVVVQTSLGKAIITGDVVFTYRNIEEDVPVGFNSNLMECFAAMQKIRAQADIILPGHDPLVVERYGWEIG